MNLSDPDTSSIMMPMYRDWRTSQPRQPLGLRGSWSPNSRTRLSEGPRDFQSYIRGDMILVYRTCSWGGVGIHVSCFKERVLAPVTQASTLDYSGTTLSNTAASPFMYYVIRSSHGEVNHAPRVHFFVLLIPIPDVLSTLLPFHGKTPSKSRSEETGGAPSMDWSEVCERLITCRIGSHTISDGV